MAVDHVEGQAQFHAQLDKTELASSTDPSRTNEESLTHSFYPGNRAFKARLQSFSYIFSFEIDQLQWSDPGLNQSRTTVFIPGGQRR
jgi:hypothetical protein